jgi:hypothetical protein
VEVNKETKNATEKGIKGETVTPETSKNIRRILQWFDAY